jgi:hypothetical protein
LHNRFKRSEATYLKAYKISGADKTIGTVVAIAAYLLGQSSTGENMKSIAETEFSFYQSTLFGGSDTARTGLRMIPAFYYRDYKLLREIYLEGRTAPEIKKISATLKAHEERGSYPTGTPLHRLSLIYFWSCSVCV